jgi:hypothetical protein
MCSVGIPSNGIKTMPISENCFSSHSDMNPYTDGTVMSWMCSVSSAVLCSLGNGYQSTGGEDKSILKFEKYLWNSCMVSHIHHYNSQAMRNRCCAMDSPCCNQSVIWLTKICSFSGCKLTYKYSICTKWCIFKSLWNPYWNHNLHHLYSEWNFPRLLQVSQFHVL